MGKTQSKKAPKLDPAALGSFFTTNIPVSSARDNANLNSFTGQLNVTKKGGKA